MADPSPATLAMPIPTSDITGLVLAGGRGSRMGGVDKGLQTHGGVALAELARRRLAPQVGCMLMNANRHLEAYRAMGVAVVPDDPPDFAGPLAGFMAGLAHAATPYLATVPCDSPFFPLDLVMRLAAAMTAEHAAIAMALTRDGRENQPQPVFCLIHTSTRDHLREAMQGGQRKIAQWAAQLPLARVVFDDASAFANVNTRAELDALSPGMDRDHG